MVGLLDWACAGLWTLFQEARALREFELQVEGAVTLAEPLRRREEWRLRHGPAPGGHRPSLTHLGSSHKNAHRPLILFKALYRHRKEPPTRLEVKGCRGSISEAVGLNIPDGVAQS